MARTVKTSVGSSLKKMFIMEQTEAESDSGSLVYKVVGFISATDFTDNAMLISNLAYVFTQLDISVCVADFKVFNPNLYQYLDIEKSEKGRGLIKMLKNDKIDPREEIIQSKYDNLYLLSPSPQDLYEEYFDFDFADIERVIDSLKNMFDLVLIDIPNNPALEFCLSAIKKCHVGFFTASERVEAVKNIAKLMDFSASVGISPAKFGNVIFMNLQDLQYDYSACKKFGLNIAAYLPFVKRAVSNSLEGNLYIKDEPVVDKYFAQQFEGLVKQLLMQSNLGNQSSQSNPSNQCNQIEQSNQSEQSEQSEQSNKSSQSKHSTHSKQSSQSKHSKHSKQSKQRKQRK